MEAAKASREDSGQNLFEKQILIKYFYVEQRDTQKERRIYSRTFILPTSISQPAVWADMVSPQTLTFLPTKL